MKLSLLLWRNSIISSMADNLNAKFWVVARIYMAVLHVDNLAESGLACSPFVIAMTSNKRKKFHDKDKYYKRKFHC